MKTYVLYGVIGWAAVIIQTAFVSQLIPSPYKPDLPFVLILFIGLSHPVRRGLIIAGLYGYCVGVFSGGPVSLFLLVYAALVLLTMPMARFFSPESRAVHVIVPFVFTFIKLLLLALGGLIVSRDVGLNSLALTGGCVEGLGNAVIARLLFPGLEFLENRTLAGGASGWGRDIPQTRME